VTPRRAESSQPWPRLASLWLPVVAYMGLIFFLSAQSNPPLPPQVSDTQGHSIGYMGLAVTVTRALAGGLWTGASGGAAAGAWAIAAAYGATDEWHQSFVPGRTADVHDWYADALGACVGAGACWAWGIIRSRTDV
jgi:VanZ family protein